MSDISKFKLPTDLTAVGVKINQLIDVMESKGRRGFTIPLYDDDLEKLARFAKKAVSKQLRDVNWRGYSLTKSGAKR